jgi:UDP-N-acetylglucosamine--N-acetylmuramyl-(pentapeptide) pyrophosphoryl-undecaprenol N-acetylglucosamine transferase
MRILSVGGGSGGHVTPIVAVCAKLHEQAPDAELRVWCDRRFAGRLREMLGGNARVDAIASGKLRRYANLTLMQHLKYHLFKTHLRNLIDVFKIIAGFVQSFCKLIVWRPDVVFCKGGFVCLPVGLAAHWLRIPLVIHDSDTVPGLTNRFLARYATKIGTGAPVENYPNYPGSRTTYIGIPVRDEIRRFTASEKSAAKTQLGFDATLPLVLAVGGGGGANALNRMVAAIAPELTKHNAQILLLAGKGKADSIKTRSDNKFKVVEFMTDDFIVALAAADIAVTRAGATALAEFATIGLPVVIVPSPHLAGDHQTKNASVYAKAQAGIVIDQRQADKQPEILLEAIGSLLASSELRNTLGHNLEQFTRANALDDMVGMILEVAQK